MGKQINGAFGKGKKKVVDPSLMQRLNEITEHQNTMYYMIATMLKEQGMSDEEINLFTYKCKEESQLAMDKAMKDGD